MIVGIVSECEESTKEYAEMFGYSEDEFYHINDEEQVAGWMEKTPPPIIFVGRFWLHPKYNYIKECLEGTLTLLKY